MPNPLIPQGTLNRMRSSILIPDFPEFNVTGPYLGKDGIQLSFEGDATTYLPQLSGAVTSPEPYQVASLEIMLIRSQALADSYKKRVEVNALVGDVTVRADTGTLSIYQLVNCSIINVSPQKFNGEDAAYTVMVKGYYNINSAMFDQE